MIKEAWKGNKPLRTVFLVYYIGFGIAYLMVFGLVGSLASANLQPYIAIPGVLFLFPYLIWILVSIWRCANNSTPVWRKLARAWVIMAIIGGLGRFAASAIEGYHNYSLRGEATRADVKQTLGRLAGVNRAAAGMTDSQARTLSRTAYKYWGSKNGSAAFHKLESAANAGQPTAEVWIGLLNSAQKHYSRAARWYRKAAVQGDSMAQSNLGFVYEKGLGVAQNYAKANYWYRKAAAQGYAMAQFRLGYEYDDGDGVPRNTAKAVYWYRKAAEQGYAPAEVSLGVAYYGGLDVPKDYAKANYWYKKAAAQGYDMAQYVLGLDYDRGRGVSKDYATANYWYKKAAAQDNIRAQINLGFNYYEGRGATQDSVRAIYWWKKAASHRNRVAQRNIQIAEHGHAANNNDTRVGHFKAPW